jgi:hypothetical protein
VACAHEPPLRALPILGIGAGVYLQLIRPWQLRWGATDDEVRRTMPGDELVARPTFNATRAVTVQAPPSLIWPWIVQIGFGKAGWYSYDLLDNFGRPSAERIIPEFQHLQAGDLVPMYQGIGAPEGVGLRVKAIEPERWMLWWDDKTHDMTWTWALYPIDQQRTRLVTRVRMRYRWTRPSILFSLLVEFADLVMMRKCLLGIKQRAENLAATTRDSNHPGPQSVKPT